MPHPLTVYPHKTLRVVPQYGATVTQYALMAQYGRVFFDTRARYNKREKSIHRINIGGANGVQSLTIPVVKPEHLSGLTIDQLDISAHGCWWDVHWGAVYSAYGRSPFFEYYAPELQPLFNSPQVKLVDFNMNLYGFCLRVLGLEHLFGMDNAVEPEFIVESASDMEIQPYYQVWASRFGFTPNLSILDLIFNLGPESPLYLKKIVR